MLGLLSCYRPFHSDRQASLKLGVEDRVAKPIAQLPDTDPFAHLTATERFAQAIERRML